MILVNEIGASFILSQKYNKIAIDVGSTLDAWAGVISRPKFKTIYKHCVYIPKTKNINEIKNKKVIKKPTRKIVKNNIKETNIRRFIIKKTIRK